MIDQVLLSVAPRQAYERIRFRAAAKVAAAMTRSYDAASAGRRTSGWPRRFSDANTAIGPAASILRAHSRDLVRNNGLARNAKRVITRNVVGYGITPKAIGGASPVILDAWDRWANSTDCDAAGRLTFVGLEKLVMGGVFEGGEMLVRRRRRRPEDGLPIPMQLQVLEPEFLDTSRDNFRGQQGGLVRLGIEYDAIGRRVAYYLYEEHPESSTLATPKSNRIDARDVIHVYDVERAGQDRGAPWLCAAIVKLKEYGEFEGAALMVQKLAQLFAGIATSPEGDLTPLGTPTSGDGTLTDPSVETLEPGAVQHLRPGEEITFSNPPQAVDAGFTTRTIREIAAAIGVTYEELTGDYSQVNFSSSRMSRLAHWGNVYDWQWNMLIPQFCDPAWGWAMDAAVVAGLAPEAPRAEWTPQAMPMTDPEKEARANVVRIRSGQATLSQVIREQGLDPDRVLAEYAEDNARLDDLGIWLDSDPRRVSQAGLTQLRAGATGWSGSGNAPAGNDGTTPDATPAD